MAVMVTFFKQGEDGFTTAGVAIALLLALTLAFGAVQACWVQSRSGQIQYVADAAALAADGAVAEVVTYAQVVDAALFTLSLLGLSSYAASAVASFIPGGQSVAARFADLGFKVFDARERFAKSAAKGLDVAQRALPALCTHKASGVANANGSAQGASYAALAVPLPLQAGKIAIKDCEEPKKEMQDMVGKEEEVQKQVKEQQEAQERMERDKERAWRADCGDKKSMCERAEHLAGLAGAANPAYSSPDTWSFDIAVARAKRYYAARLKQEEKDAVAFASDEDMAQAVARKMFYGYALKTVSENKVSKSAQGAEIPWVKALAHGAEEVKGTYLYTQKAYPVSKDGESRVLHASTACSKCGSPSGHASLEELDKGVLVKCPSCKYSLAVLVRSSQLTGIVESGFEFHYQRFVEAASSYAAAARSAEKSSGELEKSSDSMADNFKEALKGLSGSRLDFKLAGRYGCIVVVYAGAQESPTALPFVGGPTKLGNRVAVSGACLAGDASVGQATLLQQVGAGLIPSESLAGGLTKAVLGNWGALLGAYAQGVDGAQGTLEKVLNSIPLVGTDLSESVSGKFSGAIEAVGLEPVRLEAYKPVLVNTSLIAQADDSAFSKTLLKAQAGAKAQAQVEGRDIAGALETLDFPSLEGTEYAEDSLTLCTLSLLASGLGVGERELSLPFSIDAGHLLKETLFQLRERL